MHTEPQNFADSMLLVVPVPFCALGKQLRLEPQAFNGVERWADNFTRLVMAAPVVPLEASTGCEDMADWKDPAELPCRERVEFVPLPYAYHPLRFLPAYRPIRRLLAGWIARCRYLQFAFGGLFGDWAAVAALEAHHQRRPYALHADRVEDEVVIRTSAQYGWMKRWRRRLLATAMKHYHRWIVRRCALGLWNGRGCYAAYSPFCPNSHIIHDLHTSPADIISAEQLELKAQRSLADAELRICYAGRADEMKAPLEWLRAVGRCRERGVPLQATWLGDGPLLGQMRSLAAQAGLADHVTFPGFVGDRSRVLETMRSAHLMLFTHVTPESPRCLLEALLSGTPIVGYSDAYPEDLVAKAGGGRFVPVRRWDMLGDLLADLWRDRHQLAALIHDAARSGSRYSDIAVFRERSQLIKTYLGGHQR